MYFWSGILTSLTNVCRKEAQVFDWGYQGDVSQMDGAPGGHPCPSANGTAHIQGALARNQPGEELSSLEN